MMETWKEIKGYEGLYEVSDFGRVKSLAKDVKTKGNGIQHRPERIINLKVEHQRDNRVSVILSKDGKKKKFYVSRLMAEAFLPNPENKKEVDHIDGNPQNNSLSNLRWVTSTENNNNPVRIARLKECWQEKKRRAV